MYAMPFGPAVSTTITGCVPRFVDGRSASTPASAIGATDTGPDGGVVAVAVAVGVFVGVAVAVAVAVGVFVGVAVAVSVAVGVAVAVAVGVAVAGPSGG